jgi:uncharacterized repeat protein (TIGR02543 family)
LTSVINLNTIPQSINSDVFQYVNTNNVELTVLPSAVDAYKKADVWKDFKVKAIVDIAGVTLSKTATTLAVGDKETLTAPVAPDSAPQSVTWSSSNPSVATVSGGVVTAVAAGTATITATAATDTSKKATATVTVGYTVTFNSNGGDSVAPQTVAANGTVAQPSNPTLTDYYFAGWYSDTMLTTLWDFNTTVTSDTILYAKWSNTPTAVSGNGRGALRLYPNPVTNGELRVESEALKAGEKIEVYSLSGALVGVYEVGGAGSTVIDVSRLAPGVYVVKAGGSTVKVAIN